MLLFQSNFLVTLLLHCLCFYYYFFRYYMIILLGHIVVFYFNMLALLLCFCYYICMISIYLLLITHTSFYFCYGISDRSDLSLSRDGGPAGGPCCARLHFYNDPRQNGNDISDMLPLQAMRRSNTARKFVSNNFVSSHMFFAVLLHQSSF